ncbi:glycosyltransferase involved in cell wall biosynthesis [Orbus hercynius]|uniref:Glycosyltransferase involved in cell wall biosynthesis n=1 Tax=Orbus hercynius TaxID=593135 RepID=A0A495RK13_9GAMM|nr:glycosyltransferase [Orbus hercynius]RKS87699.1 glycosyltransferase involved in cell wall biosynthesis [Orbus hercynius]
MEVKLTVACITYNHEKYISQTLESFVQQKTNFPYEIIISDDCSTDRTQEIISSYAEKYPELIKPILRKKNVGIWQNWMEMADKIKSKYVALCEGDDYWIDENKLQKQVDFLDKNENFSIIFHDVKMIWENNKFQDSIYPESDQIFHKKELSLEDLFRENFIPTASVVYRWRFCSENIHNFLPKDIIPIDYYIHLLHAEKGKIYHINDVMGVYRKHDEGIWSGCWESSHWYRKNTLNYINFYLELGKHFNRNYEREITDLVEKALICFCKENDTEYLYKLKHKYPKLCHEIVIKLINEHNSIKNKGKLYFYNILKHFNTKYEIKYQKVKHRISDLDFIERRINL